VGFFGKRPSKEEAMRQAEDIAEGRGLVGKLARAFMGTENAQRLQGGLDAARASQAAASAVAAGVPTTRATVLSVVDTGQMVNHDPVVILTATLPDGSSVQMQILVSKLQIPRKGDTILLMDNPAQPGTFAYAGLA